MTDHTPHPPDPGLPHVPPTLPNPPSAPASPSGGGTVRFGEIAVALGYCTVHQVANAERLQLDMATERGIGEVLINEKALTRPRRDEILALQRVVFVTRTGPSQPGADMRLGKLAVERGIIGYAQMVRGLEVQAEARDVDGNTPPLGKVLIELGFMEVGDLSELLRELGVEVYRCDSCRTVFNVVNHVVGRRFCCPVCHSQRVHETPDRVLDVVGTLRLATPTVSSRSLTEPQPAGSSGGSDVRAGAPEPPAAEPPPAAKPSGMAPSAEDQTRPQIPPPPPPSEPPPTPRGESKGTASLPQGTEARSAMDDIQWPDATDTTFGMPADFAARIATPTPPDEAAPPEAVPTGEGEAPAEWPDTLPQDEASRTTRAPAGPDDVTPAVPRTMRIDTDHDLGLDAGDLDQLAAGAPTESTEGLSPSERVWHEAFRQTGQFQRPKSGKVRDDKTSRKIPRRRASSRVMLPPRPGDELDEGSPLMTASLPDTLAGARRRIGPYVVHEEIGRGDLGIVFRATHHQTGQRVALKVILGGSARRNEYLDRLESQAHILRKLEHPGIARLIDTGRDGSIVFVASEFVEGKPLDRWAADSWPTLEERVDLIVRLAEALAFAHDLNIVHRDVCPANIIVDAYGNPKITDFGLPRPMGEEQIATVQGATRRFSRQVFTGTAQLVGNPRYLAPEQLRSTPGTVLDSRTDQFAVGVIAYEMFAGRHPFAESADTSLVEVLERVLHEDPPLLRQAAPDAPRDLENVVFRALEKQRDRRYPGCLEFAADLQRVILGEPVDAPAQTVWTRLRKNVERHPARALTTATLALTLFVLAGSWSGVFVEFGKLLGGGEEPAQRLTALEIRRTVQHALEAAVQRGDMLTAARLVESLPVPRQRNAGEWLAVARFEQARGRLGDAFDAVNEARDIEPTYEAAILAGGLAAARGDVEAALTAWKEAARLEPGRIEPLRRQLELLRAEHRFADLADLAQAATEPDAFPDDAELLAFRGLGEGMYNQLERSARSFTRAEESATEPVERARTFYFRALVNMRRAADESEARLHRAREDLVAAIAEDPDLAGPLAQLARVDYRLREIRFRDLTRNPREREADRVDRARVLLALGRAGDALDEIQPLFGRDVVAATPEAGILYARSLAAVGEDALARRAFAAIPRGTPIDPQLDLAIGEFLLRDQRAWRAGLQPDQRSLPITDLRLAADAFTRAMTAAPLHTRAIIGRARALLELGRRHDAARDLEHALSEDPRSVEAQLWLGAIALGSGRGREARRRLREACANPRRLEDVGPGLDAATLLMLDDARRGVPLTEARARFRRLREHAPDPALALAAEADTLITAAESGFRPVAASVIDAPPKATAGRDPRDDTASTSAPADGAPTGPSPSGAADDGTDWLAEAARLLTDARRRVNESRTGGEAAVMRYIGELQVRLGLWEDARTTYKLLLDVFDRRNRDATRGLFHLPDSDEFVTVDKLARYRRSDPRSIVFHELEAMQIARDPARDDAEARNLWSRARQIRPANERLDRGGAGAVDPRSVDGTSRDSARLWRAALDQQPHRLPFGQGARDRTEALTTAEAYLRQAAPVAARVVLDQTIGGGEGDARTRTLRAEAFLHVGRTGDALRELRLIQAIEDPAAAAIDPARIHALIAAVHMAESRWTDADTELASSLEVDSNAPALRLLAPLRWRQGRHTEAWSAWERLGRLDTLRRDATLLVARTGAEADDTARLDQARTLWERGQYRNASVVLRNGITERLNSSRSGGRLQEMLLAHGVARLTQERALARDTIGDAAIWNDDQPGGATDSRAGRIARQLLGLLDGRPSVAVSAPVRLDERAGVSRASRELDLLLGEWGALELAQQGRDSVAPADTSGAVSSAMPRVRLIHALRALAGGRWIVAERELAAARDDLRNYALTRVGDPDSDALPLPVVADLARALALGGAGRVSQANAALQAAALHHSSGGTASDGGGSLQVSRASAANLVRATRYVKALLTWMAGEPERARSAFLEDQANAPPWLATRAAEGRLLASIASGNPELIDEDLAAWRAAGGMSHELRLRAAFAALSADNAELADRLLADWPEDADTASLDRQVDLLHTLVAMSLGDPARARTHLARARMLDVANPAVLRVEAMLQVAAITDDLTGPGHDRLDRTGMVDTGLAVQTPADRAEGDTAGPDDAATRGDPTDDAEDGADQLTRTDPGVVAAALYAAAEASDDPGLRQLLEAMAMRVAGDPLGALRHLGAVDLFQPRHARHLAGEVVRAARALDSAGRTLAGLELVLDAWQAAPDSPAREEALAILYRERLPWAATLGLHDRVRADSTRLLERAIRGDSDPAAVSEDADNLRQWQMYARFASAVRAGAEIHELDELVGPTVDEIRSSYSYRQIGWWWRALERFRSTLVAEDRIRGRRTPQSDAMAALGVFCRRQPDRAAQLFARAAERVRQPAVGGRPRLAEHEQAWTQANADARLAVSLEWVIQIHRLASDWAPTMENLPDLQQAIVDQTDALDSAIAWGRLCLAQRARTGFTPRLIDSSAWRLRVKVALDAGEVREAADLMDAGYRLTGDPRVLQAGLSGGSSALFREVAERLDQGPDDLPDDVRARLFAVVAAAAFRAGEFHRAADAWSRAALLDPSYGPFAALTPWLDRLQAARDEATGGGDRESVSPASGTGS